MDVRMCPKCGAPLPVSIASIESCRFCGAQGRSHAAASAKVEPSPVSMSFIGADEDIASLCDRYIANVKAYTLKEKVLDKSTGLEAEPDERLMRAVEDKMDILDGRKDDFRREIMNLISALAVDGVRFDYRTNSRVNKALTLVLDDARSGASRS
jgi:predicted Ser/Thr protein kinase